VTRIEQQIADPGPLHHVRLHRAPSLSDTACDFLTGGLALDLFCYSKYT
jgi:hypothetical protein